MLTLVLVVHIVLALLSIGSAVFQWATHYRAWGQIQQNERHINSLRSKVSYDRSEIQQMIAEQLSSRDEAEGTSGDTDPLQMMQMMAMMQGGMPGMGGGQPEAPAPNPRPEGGEGPNEQPDEMEAPEGWEGWLTEPSNNDR